jgi:hypothetical protein
VRAGDCHLPKNGAVRSRCGAVFFQLITELSERKHRLWIGVHGLLQGDGTLEELNS